MKKIKIDVISDVVCPWCYIGKKRLQDAMDEGAEEFDFEVNWKPYQLHPDLPKEGMEKEAFARYKFGKGAEEIFQQVEVAARGEELPMDMSILEVIPNTAEAHRLMYLCRQEEKDEALGLELFKSFFVEGADLSNVEELLAKAKKVGVSQEVIDTFNNTSAGDEEARREEALYRQAGVNAVPSFIINDKYIIRGAQAAETFLQCFKDV
ncbi:DsbA family oxidoreductase [Algivirga pacifica]